jgi:hypothetical protein
MISMNISLSGEQVASALVDDVEELAIMIDELSSSMMTVHRTGDLTELHDYLENSDKDSRAAMRAFGEFLLTLPT